MTHTESSPISRSNLPSTISRCDYRLNVHDLRLWVHLGCSTQEKFSPQLVSIDIDLDFIANHNNQTPVPAGMLTDTLDDTVCYAQMVNVLKVLNTGRTFNLVEHMTHTSFLAISSYLQEHYPTYNIAINITIRKMHPPVPDIHGGVSFNIISSPQQ